MDGHDVANFVLAIACVVVAVWAVVKSAFKGFARLSNASAAAANPTHRTGREALVLWIYVLCVIVGVLTGYPGVFRITGSLSSVVDDLAEPGWLRTVMYSISLAVGMTGPLLLAVRFGEWVGRAILRRSARG
jgi:hypothetical protein